MLGRGSELVGPAPVTRKEGVEEQAGHSFLIGKLLPFPCCQSQEQPPVERLIPTQGALVGVSTFFWVL